MTDNREPRDIEARLRASLHAYAEVVDEQPARRPPVAGSRGRRASSRVRGWRAPALVAAATLAVAGGAWVIAGEPSPSPTAASGEAATMLGDDPRAEGSVESASEPPLAPADAGAAAAAAAGPGGELVVPPPARVGVAYPFDLYTHCGIFGADVAGTWFAADPPLVEEFGPPAGWGDPYQRGTLTLESDDVAVFRDDAGHELTLRAAPESERPPPCA